MRDVPKIASKRAMGVVTESQPWHGYRDLEKEKNFSSGDG